MCRTLADRNLDRDRASTQTRGVMSLKTDSKFAPSRSILLTKTIREARRSLIRLTPNRFALRFDTLAGRKDDDGSIQNPQATLDLRGKVDVAGGIEQVDVVLPPIEFHAGAKDRDAPLLFFRDRHRYRSCRDRPARRGVWHH